VRAPLALALLDCMQKALFFLDLEEQIQQDRIAAKSKVKILLLGTGGANTVGARL
jgi:hypothetical protein